MKILILMCLIYLFQSIKIYKTIINQNVNTTAQIQTLDLFYMRHKAQIQTLYL